MRIDYRIFWVEDDNSWFNTNRELFEDTLDDEGFLLKCDRARSFEEVEEKIVKDGLHYYDILLIDLKLNNNTEEYGNKVIELIRGKDIYTDIIFYSSAIDRVHEIMRTHELEGVYTASRSDLEMKFEKVVKTTIRKIQEVNTMRGLLMAETSDLDQLMLEIITKSLRTDLKDHLEKYILTKIQDTAKANLKLATASESLIDKVTSRIFTSAHKAKVIGEICKKRKIDLATLDGILYKQNESFYKNYDERVLSPRNIFGHVKEVDLNGRKVLRSKQSDKVEEFTEERCADIRKLLIRYRKLLEGIHNEV